LPIYFPSPISKISRYLGWNVAPWNFEEREIIIEAGKFYVAKRNENAHSKENLIFVHFSGYNYKALLTTRNMHQKSKSHEIFYSDYEKIFDIYINSFKEKNHIFELYVNKKYSYDYYSNGDKIDSSHRRIFHTLLVNNIKVGNPFDSDNALFYKKVKNKQFFCRNILVGETPKVISFERKLVYRIFRIIFKIFGYKIYIKLLNGLTNHESLLYIAGLKR
jgi:hypothetical protein